MLSLVRLDHRGIDDWGGGVLRGQEDATSEQTSSFRIRLNDEGLG